jgi:hypothetical protein
MAKKAKKLAKKANKDTRKKIAKKAVKAGAKKSGAKKQDDRTERQPWSKDDLEQLKTLIKENTPTRLIAMKIKRSEISVRGKVQRAGLSLRAN